jgi:hypothetical protein
MAAGALRTRIVVYAGSPRMRGVDVEPLARMAMVRMVVKGTGDGEAAVDKERRRRALCMAVVLWSSGALRRSQAADTRRRPRDRPSSYAAHGGGG